MTKRDLSFQRTDAAKKGWELSTLRWVQDLELDDENEDGVVEIGFWAPWFDLCNDKSNRDMMKQWHRDGLFVHNMLTNLVRYQASKPVSPLGLFKLENVKVDDGMKKLLFIDQLEFKNFLNLKDCFTQH
jgi:hypothetical protein